ncbi:MAG: hypothetical protein ABI830_14640, partial [Pseudolabrys sp.]
MLIDARGFALFFDQSLTFNGLRSLFGCSRAALRKSRPVGERAKQAGNRRARHQGFEQCHLKP